FDFRKQGKTDPASLDLIFYRSSRSKWYQRHTGGVGFPMAEPVFSSWHGCWRLDGMDRAWPCAGQCTLSFFVLWFRLAGFCTFPFCHIVYRCVPRSGAQSLGDRVWYDRLSADYSLRPAGRAFPWHSPLVAISRLLLWYHRPDTPEHLQ